MCDVSVVLCVHHGKCVGLSVCRLTLPMHIHTPCDPLVLISRVQPQDWDIAATVRLIHGFDAEKAAAATRKRDGKKGGDR